MNDTIQLECPLRIRYERGSTGQLERACGAEGVCNRWQVDVGPVPIQCRFSPREPLTANKSNESLRGEEL